jgi:hypothetical protein
LAGLGVECVGVSLWCVGGVIRLTSFNARALRDVSAALDRLQEQGAMEHVLDLRDNMWISGL